MRHENFSWSIAVCFALVCLAGCAGVTETVRGVAGVSTKILEDGRPRAIKRIYPLDYVKCRSMVDDVLMDIKAYVYARNDKKKMIAFYLTEADTTPVGVFFVEKDNASTEVAVSSPSRYAKEFIADKIALWFDKPAAASQTMQQESK
jgi:hypothetical protein